MVYFTLSILYFKFYQLCKDSIISFYIFKLIFQVTIINFTHNIQHLLYYVTLSRLVTTNIDKKESVFST